MLRPFNVPAYVLTWWIVFVAECARGHVLAGFGWATLAGLVSAVIAPLPGFAARHETPVD